MFGPVHNAAHNAPSVATAVVLEIIGLFFVYVAIRGEIRRLPKAFSRMVNIFVFGGIGLALIGEAFDEIHQAGGSELFGVVVALIIGLPLAGIELSRRLKFKGSGSWPTTDGAIENVDVKEVRTKSSHYFLLDAAYSYSISGEYYSGRLNKMFDTESDAYDYAETLKGRPLSLKYNPVKVDVSMIAGQ